MTHHDAYRRGGHDSVQPDWTPADAGPLFKVTGQDGRSCWGGHGVWPHPPAWRTAADGLFLTSAHSLPHWLRPGVVIWTAEAGAPVTDLGVKVMTTRARLVECLGVWGRGRRPWRLLAAAWADQIRMVHGTNLAALQAADVATRHAHRLASDDDFIGAWMHLEPVIQAAAPAVRAALCAPSTMDRAADLLSSWRAPERDLVSITRRRAVQAAGRVVIGS